MIKRIFLLFAAIFFVQGHQCYGWWDEGHLLVAEIAKEHMSPETYEKCCEIISVFSSEFPQSSTFVTSSCFADDITSIGLCGFKVWHGVLRPYDPEGILSDQTLAAINNLVLTNNLVAGISQSIKAVESPHSSDWLRCFMLRMLIHFVADIHQPLHCIQLYSSQFPGGDMAGHKFTLHSASHRNLHLLWDSVFNIHPGRIHRPLSSEDQQWVTETARGLTRLFPAENFSDLDDMSAEHWSEESYELAIQFAYANVEPGATPSAEYLATGREIACSQIALAGYRLARLLDQIFQPNP